MAKKEEKNPVGRPKLADSELIKDSWCKIVASLVIVFVLTICGLGVLTARTPLQVLTFQNPNKLQGSVSKTITCPLFLLNTSIIFYYPFYHKLSL